jgi:hypothetical protein
VLFFLLAVFPMGWISQFLSRAVITGFLFGAAIEVVVGELSKITGTSTEGSNSWQKLFDWIGGLGDTDGATLLVGVVSLAIVFGLKFAAPRVPGSLVLVVVGLIASVLFYLRDRGVALIGDVPSGLPSMVLPDLGYFADNIAMIGTAAIGLLLGTRPLPEGRFDRPHWGRRHPGTANRSHVLTLRSGTPLSRLPMLRNSPCSTLLADRSSGRHTQRTERQQRRSLDPGR